MAINPLCDTLLYKTWCLNIHLGIETIVIPIFVYCILVDDERVGVRQLLAIFVHVQDKASMHLRCSMRHSVQERGRKITYPYTLFQDTNMLR